MTNASEGIDAYKLELSIALTNSLLARPIIEGRIAPSALRLIPTVVSASEIYWRQLRFGDFDVSEMSFSSLFIAVSRGDTRWVALPVYTMRQFFHTGVLVRADSGIRVPADLRNKRVGVPEYQQTSAIWTRGILQHEFGVHASDIDWYVERGPRRSHGGATGFAVPNGIRCNQIPPETNIGRMLVGGELDATLLYINERNLVDRSTIDLNAVAQIRTLFPDPEAEGRRYYAKTGIFPINHVLVVRRSLLDRHPWIALNLFAAFRDAKSEMTGLLQALARPYLDLGLLDGAARALAESDPMAYGVDAALPVIETIADYVFEQGLTDRRVGLEEVFAPNVLDV